jgi:uncharacterized protein (TIRG00374 family)
MMRRTAAAITLSVVSLIAVVAVLGSMFDLRAVVGALERTNIWLVLWAVLLGALIEVLRAQRDALMLRREHRISLERCFGARVLSHGVTRIVPIGPACFALQGLLTRRLSGIPTPYSTGVFVAGSILERLAVMPLIAFVLWSMHLPGWVRLILLGMLVQNALSLLVPLAATVIRYPLSRHTPRSRWHRKVHGAITDIQNGLSVVVAGGWRVTLPALSLSFLISAGSFLRLAILLDAFDLDASAQQIALLLLMCGLVGSMPVRVPGSDAWATGKLLRLVKLGGAGAGGFVLLYSVLTMVEMPLFAAAILVWWALPPSSVSLRFGDVIALAKQPGGHPPSAADVA